MTPAVVRLRPRIVLVGVAAVIALAVVLVPSSDPAGPVGAARKLVEADAGWTAAGAAAETLAVVAEHLLDDADRCGERSSRSAHCDGVLRAAAWAQVAAVRVLRCTPAYIVDVRRDAADLLDSLGEGGAGLESVPPTPVCDS